MGKRFHWNLTAFVPGTVRAGIGFCPDGAVTIPRAGSDYVEALRSAKVLGRQEREQQIRKDLDAATRTIPGARWREDKSLLETVVNLTEWPSVVLGSFDREYLQLPEEVLVTVMRDHQKYFAVEAASGKLAPYFLAVLNTDNDPQGLIRHGNERVLRARFNDARFFWETDQKKSLLERLDSLKHVTFQKDLGSYFDKTQRVQRLCSWLSEILKQGGITVRPGVIHKAACLSKTDLTTELVKEFTELQGIVGGLYARVQQLDHGIARSHAARHRANHLRSLQAGVDRRRCAAIDRGRCALYRRQGGHNCRDVCPGVGAQRIEGSVCAAAAGQRDREGNCGEEAAVAASRGYARCAVGIQGFGEAEKKFVDGVKSIPKSVASILP